MRVLVCGGRDYDDQATVAKILAMLDWYRGRIPADVLVHGAARGADTLAGAWAERQGIAVEAYPADWNEHGKVAGLIRNQQMLETGIDLVVAFPGGRGTEHMKQIAREAGVPVLEVT